MTNEEILEQLFDTNRVVTEIEVIPDRLFLTIRNLTGDDFLQVDAKMMETKGTKMNVMQVFGLHKASFVALSYRAKNETKEFDTPEEAYLWISHLAASSIDKITKQQSDFEKQIREALGAEVVEQTFFEPGDSQVSLEQSPEELISDTQKA